MWIIANTQKFYLLINKSDNTAVAILSHYPGAAVMVAEFINESHCFDSLGFTPIIDKRNVMIVDANKIIGINKRSENYETKNLKCIYSSEIRINNDDENYHMVASGIFQFSHSLYVTTMKIDPYNEYSSPLIKFGPLCVSNTAMDAIKNLNYLHEEIST